MRKTKLKMFYNEYLFSIGLIIVVLLFSNVKITAQRDKNSLTEIEKELIKKISPSRLKRHVTFLSSDELAGRKTGTKEQKIAARYIATWFDSLDLKHIAKERGAKSYFQNFDYRFNVARNVAGVIKGSDKELKKQWIVIGAHYDGPGTVEEGKPPEITLSLNQMKKIIKHRRDSAPSTSWKNRYKNLLSRLKKEDQNWKEPGKDKIYNGADDNASGTAGVMELARLFSLLSGENRPKRSLLFILFTGEEQYFRGSYHYSKNPIVPLDQTVAMVNLDMIGRSENRMVQYIAFSNDLISNGKTVLSNFDLSPSFSDNTQFFSSDHTVFLGKRIPSVYVHTGLHLQVHRPDDEWQLLNYETMTEIVRSVFVLTLRLSNIKKKPDFQIAPGIVTKIKKKIFIPLSNK